MPTIAPANLAAQLSYRGRGNPPNTGGETAIANYFPGLECDFRVVWKRLLTGIELHESDNVVTQVDPTGPAFAAGVQVGSAVLSIGGLATQTQAHGPQVVNGPDVPLAVNNLEWTNAVSALLPRAGEAVPCVFGTSAGQITVSLVIRQLFDGIALRAEAADPGTLTQGLCSPWQADYRECGCYYWAASRPDFVNVEIAGGTAQGHNWMQKGRTAATPKVYQSDDAETDGQLNYDDLYRNWERELRFIIGGKDEV